MASMSEMLDANNAAKRTRKEKLRLHHMEIHPERDAHGKPVKGGGHTVHSVMRGSDEGWREHTAEKPFGAGEHEEMLAHVANELKLPEPGEEHGKEDADDEGDEGRGATPAYA